MFHQRLYLQKDDLLQQDLSIQMNNKTASFISIDDNSNNKKHLRLSSLNSSMSIDPNDIIISSIIKSESKKLIYIYGKEIYYNCKNFECSNHFNNDFLLKHKISSNVRSKMVDWMLEVLDVYSADQQTFFLSVLIFDSFLANSSISLENSDVHLIGIVCMLIASKFEDLYPIQLRHAVERISHNCFKEEEIKEKEKQILTTLQFNLCFVSTYDFITFYFFDFYSNNTENIENLNLEKYLDCLENTAIFLSKMMNYSELFTEIK